MADETLRYRVEVDETSLTSELARTRNAITGAMQQAVQTGQYAVNNIHSDLQMARSAMAMPAVPFGASPGAQLAGFSSAVATPLSDFGFMGSARIAAGGAVPAHMMSDDAQRWARMELEQRAFGMTAGFARQAMPVGGALGGIGLGAMMGGPLGALGLGAAGYLGGDLLARPIFDIMEQRQTSSDILGMTRSPHPMRPFSKDQQTELARGLAMDVAKDVRFGVEEVNNLLAGGMANDAFAGVRSVEEFRGRFRAMMDNVRSITRVFQQSTDEAMQTMGQLGQMGPAGGGMGGRIADVHALARMGGMPATAAMEIGMGGARMAGAMGIPMGVGFDAMTRNAQMAIAGEASGVFDPYMFRQMGGAQGVAERATRFGFQATGALQTLLPAFANESLTGIDQARVQQFISGQISFDQVQQQAWNRLVDPASRTRFAANADLLQNQLGASGLAGPAMFRFAQMRGELTGVPAEDIFNRMASEMGLSHQERQLAMTFSRDAGHLQGIATRERESAEYRLQLERYKEESRFSNRFSAKMEEWQVGLSSAIGNPIKAAGDWIAGVGESIVTAPGRLLNWLDVTAGKAVFGDRGAPVMPTGMQTGWGDLTRSGRFLTGGAMTAGDARGGGIGNLNALRAVEMMSMEQAQTNFGNAVKSVLWKSDVRGEDFKLASKMSADDQEIFEQEAVSTFSTDLADLVSTKDPVQRKEKEAAIRQRMSGWVKTRFGAAVSDDEVGDFADKMFSIEKIAQQDDVVRKGLVDAAGASAALQLGSYVTAEMPELLSRGALEGKGGQAMEVGRQIAAQFAGRPGEASIMALRGLSERAIPLLREGTALRDRMDVVHGIMERGYLRPGDMELDSKELATVKAQSSGAGQEAFVNELIKASRDSEGHKISADVLFRSVGMGLGGEMPSNTPSPALGLDSAKWDLTSQALDKLTGAVNNLSTASEKLVGLADAQVRRTSGKM